MSEAHDGPGAGVTVEVHASPEPAGEGGDGGQVVTAPEAAAAVEIAAINAGRDIALAEIENEGAAARAEAWSNEELEGWRNRVAELEGQVAGLQEANRTLEATVAALTPPPSPEPPPNPPEPDPSPASGEEPALAPVESPSQAEEPPPPRRRGIRWT
jgi:hypothetical protein